MPKYALLILTKKDGSELKYSELCLQKDEFQNNSYSFIRELEKPENKDLFRERLNWTAYQVELSSGLETLVRFHNLAEEFQVAIKTLFFEEEPSWIITSYDKTQD